MVLRQGAMATRLGLAVFATSIVGYEVRATDAGTSATGIVQQLIHSAGRCADVGSHQVSAADAAMVAATVEGVLDGFLTHGEHYQVAVEETSEVHVIPEEEARCILRSAGRIVADASSSIQGFVRQIGQLFGDGGIDNTVLDSLPEHILAIVQASGHLRTCCESTQVINAFCDAAEHIGSISHVGDQLIMSGTDIAFDITQAVTAAHMHPVSYRGIGRCVGRIWRKVLEPTFPQSGAEVASMVSEATLGLIEGFFGPGSHLVASMGTGRSQAVHIDIRQSIHENSQFFETVWNSVWMFYKQCASHECFVMDQVTTSGSGRRLAGIEADDRCSSEQRILENAAARRLSVMPDVWLGALTASFLELPGGLSHCGLNPDQVSMITDSIVGLGRLHLELRLPAQMAGTNMANHLEDAVASFSHREWREMGMSTGLLLQDVIVTIWPQKYSVDWSGTLHQDLQGDTADTYHRGDEVAPQTASFFSTSLGVKVGVGLVAALLLVTLVMLKSHRTYSTWRRNAPQCCGHGETTVVRSVYEELDEDPSVVSGSNNTGNYEAGGRTTGQFNT